ncbi:hypothetical protein BO78DRAFT_422397 [Aspergillus sclerotiicarbonarius CBS 121057]|uniref:Uncharacterized protein n=1 Tax=Aspergillus sclerotiicarbonarius (strain CBS 121057 / IBT 28362) TaxID=1448318 RepID=A0A319EPA3_ASPSB|nr:hypothetical protein BO78DRAFT_422397 [Aspergillus sclerotiicarbonarius CBS 121057]
MVEEYARMVNKWERTADEIQVRGVLAMKICAGEMQKVIDMGRRRRTGRGVPKYRVFEGLNTRECVGDISRGVCLVASFSSISRSRKEDSGWGRRALSQSPSPFKAWRAVFGSFPLQTSSYGYVTSCEVFTLYYKVVMLPDYWDSQLGWITTIAVFLIFGSASPSARSSTAPWSAFRSPPHGMTP